MNVRSCAVVCASLLLIPSLLPGSSHAAELADGTWSISVSANPATGNNWQITGVPIGGSLSSFSGVRRSADSSFFINGFVISRFMIGANASTTPAGNRSGFVFANVNAAGTMFTNGTWTDSSGSFPFSGNFLSP
ncbi:MAG: hypothetical protein SH850_18280 [Planctomycetaceae bacterium]|nr:hypothetical protein [Planctomycetaceae bacterium]